MSRITPKDTYSLAHTARCKLRIAADRPDRDLRFVLGHAFTLDNVMLRVVEIEKESFTHPAEVYDEGVAEWAARVGDTRPTCGALPGRRVSFQNTTNKPMATLGGGGGAGVVSRNRSPPAPPRVEVSSSEDEGDEDDEGDDTEEDEEDDIVDDDDADSGDELSLRRFGSGAAKPPRLVDDDSDSEEEIEPVSPDQMPSDAELQRICAGPESKELKGLYGNVKDCPCHDQEAPGVERVWEWPRKVGEKRIAVVQFAEGGEL